MAYLTVSDLKTYLDIQGTSDDALLQSLIDSAVALVERYTGRRFEAVSDTRAFDERHYRGRVLFLGEEVVSVSSVVNGNGQTVSSSDYVLLPRDGPPYWAVELRPGHGWVTTPTQDIQVTAQWGYSSSPPQDIVHAVRRLAAYFYRQKDAQVFDVTAVPEAGVITIPKGIPADVKVILNRYRRVVV